MMLPKFTFFMFIQVIKLHSFHHAEANYELSAWYRHTFNISLHLMQLHTNMIYTRT